MNRLVLTKLLKNIVDLYVEDKFTYIYIINTLSNIENEEYDEDQNAYIQAELITTLFAKFPYYKILNELNNLGDYIIESTKCNSNFKNILGILKNGCLGDMVPDIKRRIQTEAMAHLQELLYVYKTSELNADFVISHLTKNMVIPKILTSMDYAESINYRQQVIPGIMFKRMTLRETISRANSNRKESIRRNLEEFTIENFTERELEDFMHQVTKIIEESNIADKDLLKSTIYEVFMLLFSKVVLVWEEKKAHVDYNQLSLKFE